MEKCSLCKSEIKTTFLDKLDGTIIRTGEGKTSRKFHVCSSCQKKHKEKLREEFSNEKGG